MPGIFLWTKFLCRICNGTLLQNIFLWTVEPSTSFLQGISYTIFAPLQRRASWNENCKILFPVFIILEHLKIHPPPQKKKFFIRTVLICALTSGRTIYLSVSLFLWSPFVLFLLVEIVHLLTANTIPVIVCKYTGIFSSSHVDSARERQKYSTFSFLLHFTRTEDSATLLLEYLSRGLTRTMEDLSRMIILQKKKNY
jgi:hypothetical protein